MVGRWGMSDKIGLVSVLPGPDDEPTFFPGTTAAPSEATRELVDREVRRIVDECYDAAVETLRENRDRSSRSPRRCSSARRSTRTTPTAPPASSAAAGRRRGRHAGRRRRRAADVAPADL